MTIILVLKSRYDCFNSHSWSKNQEERPLECAGAGGIARCGFHLGAPGCDRPAAIDLWADGRWRGGDVLGLLGNPVVDNLAVWQEYVAVDIPLPELARWRHLAEGMPWERA